jgi:hypothetical protein
MGFVMTPFSHKTESRASPGRFRIRAQLARAAFSRIRDLQVRFLPHGELKTNRHAMTRLGGRMQAIEAVTRLLP